jgi:nucleoside phosphorylase
MYLGKAAALAMRNSMLGCSYIHSLTLPLTIGDFIDEKHEGHEYMSVNNNNDYTLDKIGSHNVVIAVLPDSKYGISSAASVVRDILYSFPNVRISLMVGISGGVPSPKYDICLGDIVVSAPRDGNGGVFQYDFGKTIQGQSFRTTGFLDQLPVVLQTAVNGLKAQYKSKGHRIEEAINSILEKKPRLRQKYKRPDPSSDRQYQPGATYLPNDEANPTIHYSLIASANQLMKDALVRDKLAAEKDVLCFEIEPAGLMNHFPCLVVRGICDYSDSYKNKKWQGYAAMAAAAYTKIFYIESPQAGLRLRRRSPIFSLVGLRDSKNHPVDRVLILCIYSRRPRRR